VFIEGSKEGFLNQNVTEGFLCPELVEGSFPQWEAEAFRDRRSNLRGYSYLLLSVGVLYKQNNGQLLVNHMHPTRGMNRMVHTRGGTSRNEIQEVSQQAFSLIFLLLPSFRYGFFLVALASLDP